MSGDQPTNPAPFGRCARCAKPHTIAPMFPASGPFDGICGECSRASQSAPPLDAAIDQLLIAADRVIKEASPRRVLPAASPLVDAIYFLAETRRRVRELRMGQAKPPRQVDPEDPLADVPDEHIDRAEKFLAELDGRDDDVILQALAQAFYAVAREAGHRTEQEKTSAVEAPGAGGRDTARSGADSSCGNEGAAADAPLVLPPSDAPLYEGEMPVRRIIEKRLGVSQATVDAAHEIAALYAGQDYREKWETVSRLLRDVVADCADDANNFKCIVCGSHHVEDDGDPSCPVSKALRLGDEPARPTANPKACQFCSHETENRFACDLCAKYGPTTRSLSAWAQKSFPQEVRDWVLTERPVSDPKNGPGAWHGEGWHRIGRYDDARRRSTWARVSYNDTITGGEPVRIELIGGREGDDVKVTVRPDNPAFGDLTTVIEYAIANLPERSVVDSTLDEIRKILAGVDHYENSSAWDTIRDIGALLASQAITEEE